MIIERIKNSYTPDYCYRNTKVPNFSAYTLPRSSPDIFVKQSETKINFTGNSVIEKLMRDYLRQKTYKISMTGSKRPYLSIDNELIPLIKEVKINVSPLEKINAWDINPNNSKDYVVFLHGFSQNITNNQPLYKELAKTKFGVLAIDYRGYGRNPASKNIQEDDIVQDVNSAIKYLKGNGVENVGLIGHSFGAYIGAKVSSQTKPSFLVMVSPMNSLEFWLKNVIKHPKKYQFEMCLIRFVKNFKEQYKNVFNIKKYLQNNSTDMYVVQSYNDRYVRTSKVNEMVEDISNLKQYIRIRDGGHRMGDSKIKEIKKILDDL